MVRLLVQAPRALPVLRPPVEKDILGRIGSLNLFKLGVARLYRRVTDFRFDLEFGTKRRTWRQKFLEEAQGIDIGHLACLPQCALVQFYTGLLGAKAMYYYDL